MFDILCVWICTEIFSDAIRACIFGGGISTEQEHNEYFDQEFVRLV